MVKELRRALSANPFSNNQQWIFHMDLRALNWDDLRFFLWVARCGSLAQAAQKLQVTHSTVYRRINSLEGALGTKLFARTPEGYRLTSLGHDMLLYANKVSDRIDDLQRFLDSKTDHLKGVISVTAPHNLAYRYLPGFLKDFGDRYPEIQINLHVGNNDLNLSRREADLAIRATSTPPEHLIGRKLCSLAWGAYASSAYVERFGQPGNEQQLQGHRLISSGSDLLRLPAYEWLENQELAAAIVMRCNDLVAMAAMAQAGVGIAFLPDDQAKPELQRLFTFTPGKHSDLWLLTHPDLRESQRLTLFKAFLIERFSQDETFHRFSLPG
ncbi:MAG: LysR family transcriptional regulator [Halomonadaceae bacterium]|nr:MAG: LysR family transcriptional regulator [Halomonadaceae bacterium]